MITKEMAESALETYGSMRQASKGIGVSFRTLKKALGTERKLPGFKKISVVKRNTVSEKDLLKEHDPETKILAALRGSLKSLGKAEYMRDIDLRRECHANDTSLWKKIRQKKDFWAYAMVVGNSTEPMIYWGNPGSIQSLIERNKARLPNWVIDDEEWGSETKDGNEVEA